MRPADHPDSTSRDRILTIAQKLFIEQGYHGLSMREIALAAGISKAGIYYHFRDKEELFIAILVSYLTGLETLIGRAEAEGKTSREQITRLAHAIMSQPPEQRALIRLASQEMSHLGDQARAEFIQLYYRKFITRIEAIIRRGIERAEFRPQLDPRLATWTLLGMMYPYFYPSHASEVGPLPEALAEMLTIFFDGAVQPGSSQAA